MRTTLPSDTSAHVRADGGQRRALSAFAGKRGGEHRTDIGQLLKGARVVHGDVAVAFALLGRDARQETRSCWAEDAVRGAKEIAQAREVGDRARVKLADIPH